MRCAVLHCSCGCWPPCQRPPNPYPGCIGRRVRNDRQRLPDGDGLGPDGRLVVSTKEGRLYSVPPGGGSAFLWLDLTEVVFTVGEQGLIGVAFDPLYPTALPLPLPHRTNRRCYQQPCGALPRPSRSVGRPFVLLDVPRLPEEVACSWHVAGNLHFDARGYLYVTIGDYGCNAGNAQGRHTPKARCYA
ncbi:MAG: PQQ-dependent sugar dehydrogenase [Anaerolineae bacterium]|nr:MAG: PQQ-dependent sugar dehydrogenase [Anaerolineae bacterium]